MKIYLANFFSKKAEVAKRAEELKSMGHSVTARWYNEQVPHTVMLKDLPNQYHVETAEADIEDITSADTLILFTGTDRDYASIPAEGLARGGRHFETGYALALGKMVIVVGTKENVFHYLPQIQIVPTWEAACQLLR